MKTEKQVRTWWVHETETSDGFKLDVETNYQSHIERKELSDGFTEVIQFTDHLEIVKGLEKERNEWRAKAEGWFCVGCQKDMKALAEDEK